MTNATSVETLRETLRGERHAAADCINDLERRNHHLRVKLRRARAKIRKLEVELATANDRALGLEARARRAEAHCDERSRREDTP